MVSDGTAFEALLRRLRQKFGDAAPPPSPCGLPPAVVDSAGQATEHCDGEWHRVAEGVTCRCPEKVRAERSARITSERARLRGELGHLGSPGFAGFSPRRPGLMGGERALAVMERFARGRPPTCNVLLVGPTGLGKTHLLLASHFELLAGGVASLYVTTSELRRLFRRAENFDVETAEDALRQLERLVYAEVVHFDDLGHIDHDQRARGIFAEGLKDLHDRSRGKWAVSTNRTAAEAESHPDMTGTIVSRLMYEAEVVELSGVDCRVQTATRSNLRALP